VADFRCAKSKTCTPRATAGSAVFSSSSTAATDWRSAKASGTSCTSRATAAAAFTWSSSTANRGELDDPAVAGGLGAVGVGFAVETSWLGRRPRKASPALSCSAGVAVPPSMGVSDVWDALEALIAVGVGVWLACVDGGARRCVSSQISRTLRCFRKTVEFISSKWKESGNLCFTHLH